MLYIVLDYVMGKIGIFKPATKPATFMSVIFLMDIQLTINMLKVVNISRQYFNYFLENRV